MFQSSLWFLVLGCLLLFCHAQYNSSCGQTIITEDAVLTSPGYPSRYSNSLDCTWYISKVGNYKVKVNFTDFNTERNFDFVKVYDYFGNAYRLPINSNDSRGYSGRLSAFSLSSTENKMKIRFTTDGSVTTNGFRAVISFEQSFTVQPTAPAPITIPSGEQRQIDSTAYYNGTYQQWAFSNSDPDGILTITTTRLSLSYLSYLEIRDGNTSDSVIARYHGGSSAPGLVFTRSNYVWIQFRSMPGYWNSIQASITTGCYSKLISAGATITSPTYARHNRSLQCEWQIYKPSNTSRLTLYLNYFTGDSQSDFFLVRSSTGTVLNRVNGSTSNIFILTSSDDNVTINFNSSSSNAAFNLTLSEDCPLNFRGGYIVGDRHYRGRATLVCYPGYYLASSHSVASCGYRGYWSHPTAWCRRLQLPYLFASRNGTFISGSSVTIHCAKYNSVVSTLELINEDTGVVYRSSGSSRYYYSLRHTFNNLRVNDSGVYRCRETINGTVMYSNAVASITVESCDQTLTEDGTISLPGYSSSYYGYNCTWHVYKEGNYEIQIKFVDFDLNLYRYLRAYDNAHNTTSTFYLMPANTVYRTQTNNITLRLAGVPYYVRSGSRLNISFVPVIIPDAVTIPRGQQSKIQFSRNSSLSVGTGYSQQWVFENSDSTDIFTVTFDNINITYPNSIIIREGNSISSRIVSKVGLKDGIGREIEPVFVQSSTVWIGLQIIDTNFINEFKATVTAGCYVDVNVTEFGYIQFPYNFAHQNRNLSCQWRTNRDNTLNVAFYLQYIWSDTGDVLYATDSSGSVLNSQSGNNNNTILFFRSDDNIVTIHFNKNGRKKDAGFSIVYSKDCAFPNVTGGYFIGDRHYGGVATLICQEDYILTSSRGYYYVPPTNSTTCYGRYWSYPIPSCLLWNPPTIFSVLPSMIHPGSFVAISCRSNRSQSDLQLVNSKELPAQVSTMYSYYSERRFVFNSIRFEDSGNYRCKETINGRVRYSKAISLNVTPCNWNITKDGIISSPNYPSNYPNNQDCVWNLNKEGNYRVEITFTDFYLYSYGDYVYVYDYVNNNNNDEYRLMNSRYTGRKYSSFSLKSTGNKMKVRFTSNSYYANRGFTAQVKFESTQTWYRHMNGTSSHIGIITQALGQRFMDSVQAVYVLFTKAAFNTTNTSLNFK